MRNFFLYVNSPCTFIVLLINFLLQAKKKISHGLIIDAKHEHLEQPD